MPKLTVRALDAAKPRSAPYKLVVDRGLQMRVAPDGGKTWLVRYMIDGRERQYRLPKPYGTGAGFLGLQGACDEAARIRALARDGTDWPVQHERDRQATEAAARQKADRDRVELLTVRDLFDLWIVGGVERKDGGAEIRRMFDKDVFPAIGAKPVRDVTEGDVRALVGAVVERGCNRLAVLILADLRQMFRWGEKRPPWRRLLIDGNPAELVKAGTVVADDYEGNERTRVLSVDEIRELRDALDAQRATYAAAPDARKASRPLAATTEAALWIMLATTCRVGEIARARWEHIDDASGVWLIPAANAKNAKPHMIYLSEFAREHFAALRREAGASEWVMPARRRTHEGDAVGHVDVKTIGKQIADRQAALKIDDNGKARKAMKNRTPLVDALVLSGGRWTAHDLRRTGATMMQALGVAPLIIDRCLNHVEGNTLRRVYMAHDYAAEKREAWRLLGDRITSVLNADATIIQTSSKQRKPRRTSAGAVLG